MIIGRVLWNDKCLQWIHIYLNIYIIESENYNLKDFDNIMCSEGSNKDKLKQIVEIEYSRKLKSWGMRWKYEIDSK